MTFDAKGYDKLISAFATILKDQICELNVTFDLSVINMKKTNLKDVSIILKIDNSIKRPLFYRLNETIIWAIDKDDADFGWESFVDCKKNGCFFPAEFIRMQIPKNKNVDDMYCELVNSI